MTGREPGQPQTSILAIPDDPIEVLRRYIGLWPDAPLDEYEAATEALAECGRLREQLDATAEALTATRLDAEKTYAWRERFEERAIRAEAELRMVEARVSVAETMKGQLP